MYYYFIFKAKLNYYIVSFVNFSSRIIDIQAQMTERCIELLLLPEDSSCLLLDIGCGSGLSGTVLEENGHMWIGMDISQPMLGEFN